MKLYTDESNQEHLEARRPGSTIIPVIVSSDKTQLTLFRDKMAYPIYLTISNIPKDIRRKPSRHAQILIGYIPTTKLPGMQNKSARRRALANLFHACMRKVLGPISSAGETGLAMMSGDGVWRRCHPIFAIFVGDYPEQTLVTCTFNGRCPKCLVPLGQLGEYDLFPSRTQRSVIGTYRLAHKDIRRFHQTCREARLKPIVYPFWETFPLADADIFISITPDILHQMLQGVMKHLIGWLIRIFGPSAIDARCKSMPPNHKILLFTKGIATLCRISGHEHKKMCGILLGLIVDLPVPGGMDSSRLVKAVRALLDFLFLAEFHCHTSGTLSRLEDCLAVFHNNKAVFVDLGIRENFEIPKLHSLLHYASSIRLFGTTDNYNTEQSERLHIDLAKDAYRATNRKDEYAQMTTWLERREKVQRHSASIDWRQNHWQNVRTRIPIGPLCMRTQAIKMAQTPSRKAVPFPDIFWKYGAPLFQDTLADFIAGVNNPGLGVRALRTHAANTLLPFRTVRVYHNIKFTATSDAQELEIVDAVYVRPEQKDSRGRIIPVRFDTVLIQGSGQRK
jgi:Plavaka transposase